MKVFIGSLIFMGIVKLRNVDDYFLTDSFFDNYLKGKISRNNLCDHLRFFTSADSENPQDLSTSNNDQHLPVSEPPVGLNLVDNAALVTDTSLVTEATDATLDGHPVETQVNSKGKDPLAKVRPLMEDLQIKFKKYWIPYPNVSVDEAMIKTRCKYSGFRMYIKEKPTRWGYKFWEIVDQKFFLISFEIYTSKKGNDGNPEKGLGKKVIFFFF